MELIQQSFSKLDGSFKDIEVYMLSIAVFGLIACSVTIFFPYKVDDKI